MNVYRFDIEGGSLSRLLVALIFFSFLKFHFAHKIEAFTQDNVTSSLTTLSSSVKEVLS